MRRAPPDTGFDGRLLDLSGCTAKHRFLAFSLLGGVLLYLPVSYLLNLPLRAFIATFGFYDPSTDWVLPHNVPPIKGGLAFRWVMAADTLHERYERHGVAWYEARNAALRPVVEAGLAALEAAPGTRPSEELLGAMDNLSVGLDYAHEPAAAIDVQRRKAALLPLLAAAATPAPQPIAGDNRWHYTTWANLGSHLVHANAAAALGGDADAIVAVEEGLACIDRAVAINPGAHFGRELWQAVAIRYLLAGIRKPEVFTTWDLIGNRYDAELPTSARGVVPGYRTYYMSPNLRLDLFSANDKELSDDYRESLRRLIKPAGMERDWSPKAFGMADVDMREGIPFDEPMLGIIGMWQFGGGPHPLFAITIGNTMERVGQPYIAWDAFARALQMQERLPGSPETRAFLVAHCTARQAAIETLVSVDHAELQRRHDAELAIGTAYQTARDAAEVALLKADPEAWRDEERFRPPAFPAPPNTPFSGYDRVILPWTFKVDSSVNSDRGWFSAVVSLLISAALGGLVSLCFNQRRRLPAEEGEAETEDN